MEVELYKWVLKDKSVRFYFDRHLQVFAGGWDSDTGRVFDAKEQNLCPNTDAKSAEKQLKKHYRPSPIYTETYHYDNWGVVELKSVDNVQWTWRVLLEGNLKAATKIELVKGSYEIDYCSKKEAFRRAHTEAVLLGWTPECSNYNKIGE